GQREAGVLRYLINGLYQALAEGGFAHDQSAVMVLQGAGDNLGRRGGSMVDEDNDRVFGARLAVGRTVDLLGISASALRNDDLAAMEELVADRDRLRQQTAGISAQVENQALRAVAKTPQRVVDLAAGRLLKAAQVDIADAGLDLKFQVDAVIRNFIPNQV